MILMAQNPNNIKTRSDFAKLLASHGFNPESAGRLVQLASVLENPTSLQNTLLRSAVDGEFTVSRIKRLLRIANYPSWQISLTAQFLEACGVNETDPDKSDSKELVALSRVLGRLLAEPESRKRLIEAIRAFVLRENNSSNERPNALIKDLSTMLEQYGMDPDYIRGIKELIRKYDDVNKFRELARIARSATLIEDSCISIAEPNWRYEPAFERAYSAAKQISAWGRDISWRVHILTKLAANSRQLEGDFVECGVDTGGTAMAVLTYLGDESFKGRSFYLFDTFKGLVKTQLTEEEQKTSLIKDTRYKDVLSRVQSSFSDKAFVKIIQGSVPETLSEFRGSHVAYLHIDMNVSLPEIEALKFFWPKLSSGAPVIFDDYGFKQHQPQRVALDQLAAEFGVEIIMLPTCQGLLIKP